MVIYWIELCSHGIYIDYQQHHVDVQCKTLNITENIVTIPAGIIKKGWKPFTKEGNLGPKVIIVPK